MSGALPPIQVSRKLIDTGEVKLSLKWAELIPRPTIDEVDHITKSIKKFGQTTPIVVDQSFILIDGYTRYKICKRLRLPIWYETRQFNSDKDRRDFSLIANVERRHLKAFDRVRLFRDIYHDEVLEARKRRQEIGKYSKHGTHKLHTGEGGRAMEKFAKTIGISEHTARRALTILDEASNKEVDMVTKGVISITSMYHTLAMRKRRMDEVLLRVVITVDNRSNEHSKTFRKELTKTLYDNLMQYIKNL